jgi:GrpB-like predicted nucleotidyltransferase (UPF0157 family)
MKSNGLIPHHICCAIPQNDLKDEIKVVDHDPKWASYYFTEAQKITEVLGDLVPVVEHVGSTAVPSLSAKPIIDILVGVNDMNEAMIIAKLEDIGYIFQPDAGGPDRLFFRKGAVRTHHVHVVKLYSWTFWKHVLFRDHLITHPNVRDRYGALKQVSAERYRFDRDAYTESKAEFIEAVLRKATLEEFITVK